LLRNDIKTNGNGNLKGRTRSVMLKSYSSLDAAKRQARDGRAKKAAKIAILSIENECAKKLDTLKVVHIFEREKARQQTF